MQLSKRVSKHFGVHAALGETQMKVGGMLVSSVSARRVQITRSSRRVPRKGVPERNVPCEKAQPAMLRLVSGSAESAHLRVQVRLREIPRTVPSPLRITDWLLRHARDGYPRKSENLGPARWNSPATLPRSGVPANYTVRGGIPAQCPRRGRKPSPPRSSPVAVRHTEGERSGRCCRVG
jgi:hypothetical protein